MPTSGFVIVCEPAQSEEISCVLGEQTDVTVGPLEVAGRIPVVVSSANDDVHRTAMKTLRNTTGVLHVELVFADYRSFDGDDDVASKGDAHVGH